MENTIFFAGFSRLVPAFKSIPSSCINLFIVTWSTNNQRKNQQKPIANCMIIINWSFKHLRLIRPYSTFAFKRLFPSNMNHPKISLTDTESKICTLLKDFCQSQEKQAIFSKPITLRITGGWVRDKLLGLDSYDLDIAVDHYTGLEFAEALSTYIKKYSKQLALEARSIHKIERNPEKSKHLETATTKLYGRDIDFVNLRCEEYADNSRIPVVRFGTPEEDAYRRDATINALFYNIQTESIEDFTKHGLTDLKAGIIRTPLSPLETFSEDPLRVLRLIRFSARFGFDIYPPVLDAMADKSIESAFIEKISRERVGIEIHKTLLSQEPAKGLCIISQAGLENAVFCALPKDSKSTIPSVSTWKPSTLKSAAECLQRLTDEKYISGSLASRYALPNYQLLLWTSLPYLRFRNFKGKTGKKEFPAAYILIAESLKMVSTNDANVIAKGIDFIPEVKQTVSSFSNISRKELGLFLRECGKYWPLYVVYALVDDLINGWNDHVINQSAEFINHIHQLNLDNVYELRPLLNGGEITQKLNRKAGPWVKPIMDKMIELQLDKPETTKEDCLGLLNAMEKDL